jgi:AcrR family transcriptional regulator
MQEIARASGYTAASLYSYFASKDEIAAALFQLLASEILATFEVKAPTGSTFAQRVELLVWSQLALAERHREPFALFQEGGPELMAACKADHSVFADAWTRWMRANAKPADIGGADAAEAAAVLGGITFTFLKRWWARPKGHVADRAPDIARWFLHGVSGRKVSR